MSTTRRGFLGTLLSLPVIGPWLWRKAKAKKTAEQLGEPRIYISDPYTVQFGRTDEDKAAELVVKVSFGGDGTEWPL